MENKENNEIVFEDISSISPEEAKRQKKEEKSNKNVVKTVKKVADDYGEVSHKNIDKAIKAIAYIVSITFFVIFLAVAVVLFVLDKSLIFLSAIILVVGGAVSLIFLYLIYGLGYIISQNKEILRRLK